MPMCGFDCIPSDLGVYYSIMKMREWGVESIKSCHTYANMPNGGLSGGTTLTSMLMEKRPNGPFELVVDQNPKEHLTRLAQI